MKKVNIIIPCYNSEKTIEIVVEEIMAAIKLKYEMTVILINDGSPDGVWGKIDRLCKKYSNVKGISLSKNYGQQNARMAAIPYITGDYVVFMDDDGQHNPRDIEKLIDRLDEGYDVVYASFQKKKETLFRRMGSRFNRWMLEVFVGKPRNMQQNAFFATRRFVVEQLRNYNSTTPILVGYFLQVTRNITDVPLEHHNRIEGRSNYNFVKLVRIWMDSFTGFSIKPLRLASLVGFFFSIFGFILGAVVVVRKVINHDILAGYTSLAAILFLSLGLNMMMMGILGEYIGRMCMVMNNIPQYVIRETRNLTEKSEDGELCTRK